MRVVLDLPCYDQMPIGTTEQDICIVLADALAEYTSHRAYGNGETYVNKRYPDSSVYTGERRAEKIKSVSLRCKIADRLHSFRLTLE